MTPQTRNRLTIVVIFAMTIVPFLIALGLKQNPTFLNKEQTNYGQLVSPVVPTLRSDFIGFDEFSTKNMAELAGHWLIVNVIPGQHCNEVCLDALLKTKQLRVMLNKELMRTRRVVVLVNDVAPELAQQWWLKDSLLWRLQKLGHDQETELADKQLYQSLLQEQNNLEKPLIERLIANENKDFALNSDLIRVKPNKDILNKITTVNEGSLPDGALFLMDPLGNIMMRYQPGFDPYKVKNDLMHLLRISQLG